MCVLMAGTAGAMDQFDGSDYAYGADAYSIRENQAAEQRENTRREMEYEREMQRQLDSQRQQNSHDSQQRYQGRDFEW